MLVAVWDSEMLATEELGNSANGKYWNRRFTEMKRNILFDTALQWTYRRDLRGTKI